MERQVNPELIGGKDLEKAINQAAVNVALGVDPDAMVTQENEAISSGGAGSAGAGGGARAVSPLTGAPVPAGRPRGVKNKLTNLRDAVIEAFDRVGGVDYLVKLANGTQSDRAAFTSLMNKVLPTQINQQVDGGIRLELSWLGSRNIGTTQAQIPEHRTQVLDVEQDSDGSYRIKDQHTDVGGTTPGAAEGAGAAQGRGT